MQFIVISAQLLFVKFAEEHAVSVSLNMLMCLNIGLSSVTYLEMWS